MNNLQAWQKLDRVNSRSALSPGLWLVGIFAVTLLPITPLLPFWAAVIGWVMFVIVALGVLGVFLYFAICKPELLRSDEFSLKSQALSMYGDGTQPPSQISRILSAPAITPAQFIEDRTRNVGG